MAINPEPTREFIILLQRLLQRYAGYDAGIDGVAGPRTIKAIESLTDINPEWDRNAKIIGGIQSMGSMLNLTNQPVDGIMSPATQELVRLLDEYINKNDFSKTEIIQYLNSKPESTTYWHFYGEEEFWAKYQPAKDHLIESFSAFEGLQQNGINELPKKGDVAVALRQAGFNEYIALFEVNTSASKKPGIEFRFLYEFLDKPSLESIRSLKEFYNEFKDYAFYPISKHWFEKIVSISDLRLIEADKIPFHLDNVENTDRLSREPIAKSLTRLINSEIFKDKENVKSAFMIHLQGAWGAGKSTFLNLIKKHLPDEKDWIVIEFNAWQNQHIDPPWWTFLTAVYKQSVKKIRWYKLPLFFILEGGRRFLKFNGYKRLIQLAFIAVFIILAYHYYDGILDYLGFEDKSLVNAKVLDAFKDALIAIGGVVGSLYAFVKFLTTPLSINSPNMARSFLQKANDPMKAIKKHFEGMVTNINRIGYKLAIFIDDIDRCNAEFVVELLEGIQTLFKDKGVLYIVAGDRRWISTCFENHYTDYKGIASEPAQQLGYLFLEKAFQLSVRLPKVSPEAKEEYWKYILNPESEKVRKEPVMTNYERSKMKEELASLFVQADLSRKETIDQIAKEKNLDRNIALDMALEVMDEDKQDLKHLLENHFALVDSNPRSIKRLANEFTINRNILTAEGRSFDQIKLFRWIIIQNKYPAFADWLIKNQDKYSNTNDWPENLQPLLKIGHWRELMYDEDDGGKDELTSNDIANFANLSNL